MAGTRTGRWRLPLARTLTVIGVLLVFVSIAANWVERQVLDTGTFEETARQLITDPMIQDQVAANLTNQLFTRVDIQSELEQQLPEAQKGLAGPITGALRPVAQRLVGEILDRPRFQEVWVDALGLAQQQVVKVLDDKARFIETNEGIVVLDLRPLLVELTKELPVVPDLSNQVPEDAGVIQLFEAQELETAQTVTKILRFVADWIWVLALAAWIGAVLIARDRRREVRAVAIGFVVVGLLLLLARRIGGRYVVDQLSSAASDEDAVKRTWDILTQLLADAGWAAIGVGIVALVGVWIAGPAPRGTAVRRWLAPYLRQPGLTYGLTALAIALLLIWGPISYVRKPSTVLVLVVLAFLGVEAVRRKAANDFPDAVPGGAVAAVRASAARVGGGRSGAPSQAEELERLADLKDKGVLTDEEFASAKARLLGGG
ncbi:MAG TPA: SHOCT domain-containing protein [Gaiellaceae bacterium]|jgi:hypothetical protein